MQHPSSHGRDRTVDNIKQCAALFGLSAQKLQIADGELVQPYVFVFLYTAQMLDMSRLQVLGHVEVHQNTSGCCHACRHFLQTESFERRHAP